MTLSSDAIEEKMEFEVVIDTQLLDGLALLTNTFSFFSEDTVHGRIITCHNPVLHVGFGSRQAKLNENNLGIGHTGWSTSGLGRSLCQDEASLNYLCIIDHSSTSLYDEVNVSEVHSGGFLDALRHTQHRDNSNGR
jgi:hypothetical protein